MHIMTDSPIRFPGLFGDWAFTASGVAFHIGGKAIYWYGIIIALGVVLALWFCMTQREKYGITEDDLLDAVLWGVPLAIVGARLYYVIFYLDLFKKADGSFDWGSAIAIWDGGLAIYGGVIAAFLTGFVLCRKKGIKMGALTDLVVMGFLIGQAVGRWGNFMNREAFGTETTMPWRMELTTTMGTSVAVHPTFLYESIWCFVGFLLLFRYIKKRKFNGDIALRYMIWYGAGRFWIEALRTDSLMLVPSIGLRASQLVAGIAVVVGVAAEIYFTHKFKDKPLMVKLAMTADNKAAVNKLSKEKTVIGLMTDTDTELLASSPRKLFVERTEAYNAEVKRTIAESRKTEK